ncbi:MAG: hypothetical protein H0W76_08355 [Pyrinomonadaceae bacterium]|nr:hypothetical protein [Pyrinomonadaceae bacterium]
MALRMKMRAHSVQSENNQESINLGAVYSGDPEDVNHHWSLMTPSATLMATINNPQAFGQIEQGKEYFVDITPVDITPVEG